VLAPPHFRRTLGGILGIGLAAAALAAGGAWALERARFGPDDAASVARVETDVRARFDASAATLRDMAARATADRDAVRGASRDTATARQLFDTLASAIPAGATASTGVTVYDPTATPVAWAGRVVDLPRLRLDAAQSLPLLFVAPDALGPRLVRIQAITDRARPAGPRLGTVVTEQLLSNDTDASDITGNSGGPGSPGSTGHAGDDDTFIVSGSLVPVSLRAPTAVGAPATAHPSSSPYAFTIPSSDGRVLVEARVSPDDLSSARLRWRGAGAALVWSILGLTLIACVAPLIELRRRALDRASFVSATIAIFAIIVGSRAMAWPVARGLTPDAAIAQPFELFANALMLAALVWLVLDLAERRRLARRRSVLDASGWADGWASGWIFSLSVATGIVVATGLWAYERFLRGLVNRTGLDLLHFSLHPLSASRIAISFSLVLLHAAAIWSAALVLRLLDVASRRARRRALRRISAAGCVCGFVSGTFVATLAWGPAPLLPFAAAVGAACACALALSRPRGPFRRASQAARLALFFVALLAPALAMYPSLDAFSSDAKEQVVAQSFAPQVLSQRDDLLRQGDRTLQQIDAMPGLPSLVEAKSDADAPSTDQAYTVWSDTTLREHRITSAIELYSANGNPVSRFALNLPEYTLAPYRAPSCQWVLFEEVSSFAASDRHVLRATRGICTREGQIGSVVVRLMLDYRTLPFISTQRPDIESLRSEGQAPAEAAPGRDVEFTVYGWSRAPLYTFGSGVWPLENAVFDRLLESRRPFWTTVDRDDARRYRVYFVSDRRGIYALGYPTITAFGHLVNLAELISLTFVLWTLIVGGATLFNALTSRTPAGGRALLRELRSSFYLKLWLAFISVVVVPVLILAYLAHTYFANQFRAGVEQDALSTATTAQRLVEDYASLQQNAAGGTGELAALDDQVMILVSQAIDQDVNLFDPKRLQATSQPDLFASGVLPLRTPGDVYRSVALDRLPTFVKFEQVGQSGYLLAAARVRAGQREGIVTVPLTLRAQELDRQIDDLDRQVLFASMLFVLLGGSLGYWMAERIADPVSRLTRATHRIAGGDLDARIATTSSDELKRLVEDFNHMAADLKRQRTELERTQRLEAWADMARQVAHDIKNPLTPIQLSAEHARRINNDSGRPLSPVLDECVGAILTQVKLLRQIAAEFSSFASSPTPKPETTDVRALIEEVVGAYRAGLAGRVSIDVQAAPDLPRAWIDRTLFSRTLTNLIENALYAMPGGGSLTIASRPGADRTLIVSVADTGAGMDQEALRRIFEPYFSTKASGTGLGLTIAKRNVELNGGTIRVESERGVGTTVTMTVPAS
jgi:signal transduction histidine kinase